MQSVPITRALARHLCRSTIRDLRAHRSLPQTPIQHHRSLHRPSSTTSVPASNLHFGQPLHETHPHLLAPGELTPGITALEYATRRTQLASLLPPDSIAILPAASLKYRSDPVVFYPFRQQSDFWYLTGFAEPDAVAVIRKTGNKGDGEHEFTLLCKEKDEAAEKWEGFRSGMAAARDVFKADAVGNVEHVMRLLPEILEGAAAVYTDVLSAPGKASVLSRFFGSSKASGSGGERTLASVLQDSTVRPLRPLLNALRITKSSAEIELMRQVGQISGRAITNSMRETPTFSTERDLATFLDYETERLGCPEQAYVPVIAGGSRGQCIHYVANDQVLKRNEMIMVDAGGELGGYITDITRCWPADGTFRDGARDLYEMVLGVQRTCVSMCRQTAGLSLDGLHGLAADQLRSGLEDLGFKGLQGGGLGQREIDVLFPHHVGHYIGLDVHDSPGWPRSDKLKKGMCVAVEPAVYVPDDESWPKHFRGLAIRIEDSVCVGEESPVVLTTEALKEIVDIEDWMR